MIDYAEEFLIFRAKRNLTQAKLAELLGISRMSVYNIESGKTNPSKVDTFTELVAQLEYEGQIDNELAEKYRVLVAKLKSLKEI